MQAVDISNITYESKYADPNHVYSGGAAVHFAASDLISKIFSKKLTTFGYESRYFSYVVGIDINNEYWTFSIDMDLLDMNNIEIIAFLDNLHMDKENIRVHLKGLKWYDNIDTIRGSELKTTAAFIAKVVKELDFRIKGIFSNRSTKYCVVLAEKFIKDFE